MQISYCSKLLFMAPTVNNTCWLERFYVNLSPSFTPFLLSVHIPNHIQFPFQKAASWWTNSQGLCPTAQRGFVATQSSQADMALKAQEASLEKNPCCSRNSPCSVLLSDNLPHFVWFKVKVGKINPRPFGKARRDGPFFSVIIIIIFSVLQDWCFQWRFLQSMLRFRILKAKGPRIIFPFKNGWFCFSFKVQVRKKQPVKPIN